VFVPVYVVHANGSSNNNFVFGIVHMNMIYFNILLRLCRPQELDDAVRRRFVKRFYVPLPEQQGRRAILRNILKDQYHTLTDKEVEHISVKTDGKPFFIISSKTFLNRKKSNKKMSK
jgi:hypothetical protein